MDKDKLIRANNLNFSIDDLLDIQESMLNSMDMENMKQCDINGVQFHMERILQRDSEFRKKFFNFIGENLVKYKKEFDKM